MPYKDFFCQKFKKCNQISIKFCYVVKGILKLLCGWFMNWLHLLPYFLPHKLSVATKNIRRGKVLLVKQQVKGSYPHGIELLFILGTSLSIGWKPQLGNWAKISCEECHWPISMVRLVKLMVKLVLNACQVIRLIHTMTHFVDYYSRSTGPYHILAWDLLDIVASPSGQEVRQVIWWNDISMWPDPVKHAYTLGNISTYYLLLPLCNFSLFFQNLEKTQWCRAVSSSS